MVVSDVEAREIRKVIAQLKADITELEIRLQQDPTLNLQGSLKSVAIRVLISAERIKKLISTKEKSQKNSPTGPHPTLPVN
jgi:hypothetical protein